MLSKRINYIILRHRRFVFAVSYFSLRLCLFLYTRASVVPMYETWAIVDIAWIYFPCLTNKGRSKPFTKMAGSFLHKVFCRLSRLIIELRFRFCFSAKNSLLFVFLQPLYLSRVFYFILLFSHSFAAGKKNSDECCESESILLKFTPPSGKVFKICVHQFKYTESIHGCRAEPKAGSFARKFFSLLNCR